MIEFRCPNCKKEIKVGQRIVQSFILLDKAVETLVTGRIGYGDWQHAYCFDADGPRYDDNGEVIVDEPKGYIKRESKEG